ncbi:O-acetyl-ADP-ribose deacetylase [Algicola sagamiensis]|uniref:O-acetyl-ADP-ribose deacetylase n=1 Tax=Algicola sagamiensis TaxID=163869 RepID=UPI000364C6F5|nr:O-acetyl-ADP-ribose deacetylase [Algicola sagamiensis]
MDRVKVQVCDITTLNVDAIVNAANETLLGGGGVDGAIHKAAGPELREACKQLGGCKVGQAKMTDGFNLPARHVIHTVGPVWKGGDNDEAKLLASCYHFCLSLAVEEGIRSIAFPAISCGAYGYPVEEAAKVAVTEISAYVAQHWDLDEIILACFDDQTASAFLLALDRLDHAVV